MKKEDVSQAKIEIAKAAGSAVDTIAIAAKEAAKVIADAASEALRVMKAKNESGNCDHDLIVSLGVKMEDIKSDIKDIKDNTAKRIDNLEKNKLNISDSYPVFFKPNVDGKIEDHEARLRGLETGLVKVMTWGSAAVLAVGIAEFLISRYL